MINFRKLSTKWIAEATVIGSGRGRAKVAAGAVPAKTFSPVPAMTELPHAEKSLASRARPDLGSAVDRHSKLTSDYSVPGAKSKLRSLGGSMNKTYEGHSANGLHYIVKPQAGIGHDDPENRDFLATETEDYPKRHNLAYSLMSAMGAHHMAAPGMAANVHDVDGPEGAEHTGGKAHVQEFVPGKQADEASQAELNGVDREHRLHGIVSHLLTGNKDGHAGNVLIHSSGHPVLIDHDYTFGTKVNSPESGPNTFMSAFAPGGPLDYQAKQPLGPDGKPAPVGTNFPPRMRETLERTAGGYYQHGPGRVEASDADHEEARRNASELLTHGVEGTLARRRDLQKEFDAAAREKQVKGESLYVYQIGDRS